MKVVLVALYIWAGIGVARAMLRGANIEEHRAPDDFDWGIDAPFAAVVVLLWPVYAVMVALAWLVRGGRK